MAVVAAEQTLELEACAREAIHVPDSIQPYGLLLAVDQATDVILQAAGDAARFLKFPRLLWGSTAAQVLGVSVADLARRAETVLLRDPVFLGTLVASDCGEFALIAHQSQDTAIVEVLPTVPSAPAAKILASIRSFTERIGEASDLIEACVVAAREMRKITGYDHVMIYRFFPDGSGSVVAESKEGRLSSLLNHRFPASDIPQQARDLYRRNAIRTIPDVAYRPALLVPATLPTTNLHLDMSYCVLRSVSPVHVQYLKNMGVGASMSVSLLPRGELWGLITCHNRLPRPVPYEVLEACRHVGQILSQQIQSREEAVGNRIASNLSVARDNVMRPLFAAEDPAELIRTLGRELQLVVPSDGAALVRKGGVVSAGNGPSENHIRQIAVWLERRMSGSNFFVTDRLNEDWPEAAAFTSSASGLVSVRLPGDDPVFLMWFRAEQVEEVNWAGNPHKPAGPDAHLGALSPRKSFAAWRETVRGRSRPWHDIETESARQFAPRIAFVLQQKSMRELNRLLGEANERLAALASTDALTGVANRRAFDVRLQRELTRASRSRRQLALITLDLDYFKQYNDHYGHAMGDACLQNIARVLQTARRESDLAARIGGEEFALILPNTSIQGAVAVAESIRACMEDLQLPHKQSPLGVVTASVGVAVANPNRPETVEALMDAADKALYQAKRTGRNRVVAG